MSSRLTGAQNTRLCLVATKAASGHTTYNQSFLPPPTTALTDAEVCISSLYCISENVIRNKGAPVSPGTGNNAKPCQGCMCLNPLVYLAAKTTRKLQSQA